MSAAVSANPGLTVRRDPIRDGAVKTTLQAAHINYLQHNARRNPVDVVTDFAPAHHDKHLQGIQIRDRLAKHGTACTGGYCLVDGTADPAV